MPAKQTVRFLFQAAWANALASDRLRLEGETFHVEPLFQNTPAILSAAGPSQWYVAESHTPAEDISDLWEMAHRAMASGLGVADTSLQHVEPDLLQEFPYPASAPIAGFSAAERCASDSPSPDAPAGPGLDWHLRREFSGLSEAREQADHGAGIRIGILDTGYDPKHSLLPRNLRADRAMNFVETDREGAVDPDIGGLLQNPGHGTATMCILAGRDLGGIHLPPGAGNEFLGGAPLAEMIPVRVANSVVLFHNSALARGLDYLLAPKGDPPVDIVSISLGGVASGAWAEAVNRAYDLGVCIVAAAGNSRPGGFPTRNIVYPARFGRVIAVCGAMANHKPYANLPNLAMEGNYGPPSKMRTAIAAYAPNVAWAKIACPETLDLNGAGTSACAPQVAAAAALWLARNKDLRYAKPWQRVEAVRKALFEGAQKGFPDSNTYFGQGQLDAMRSLTIRPAENELKEQPRDSASFAFLRLISGLGMEEAPASREEMLQLEMVQLSQRSATLERIVPDPGGEVTTDQARRFVEALVEDKKASKDLRIYLADRYTKAFGSKPVAVAGEWIEKKTIQAAHIPEPSCRYLRAYAFDPSLSLDLENEAMNRTTLLLPWEPLRPGPDGEYIKVMDEDMAGNPLYAPVPLDHPFLLAQDGLPPQAENPQFHQQMVYGVARKTIQCFEDALGRPIFWSGIGRDPENPLRDVWTPQIGIRPHASNQANAFYSPQRKELLFGTFIAKTSNLTDVNIPGERIYTCLSHDIVAHETTHAILDGLHYRLREPTNPDMLAFHEGFSDVVALFQHFSVPGVLEAQILANRGNLEVADLLTGLARQFGRALGKRGALRSGIGKADPAAYQTVFEPHSRGAILVAAIFDAFLTIYRRRAADVINVATAGSGILPQGRLPQPLVKALAKEASDAAAHVLRISIRALDYVPPVDLTLVDYLRALITADHEWVPEDKYGYRLAFVEAFRHRGIHPKSDTLSITGLLWPTATTSASLDRKLAGVMRTIQTFAQRSRFARGREKLFRISENYRIRLHQQIVKSLGALQDEEREELRRITGLTATNSLEIHVLRIASRAKPDGTTATQAVLEITQSRTCFLDEQKQTQPFWFRGGSTLIIDLEQSAIRYAIVKDAGGAERLEAQREYLRNKGVKGLAYFRNKQFETSGEPFYLLHEDLF
jgi:hypothetical protein